MSFVSSISFRVASVAKNVDFYKSHLSGHLVHSFETGISCSLLTLDTRKGAHVSFTNGNKSTLVELLEEKTPIELKVGTAYGHLAFLSQDIYQTCDEIEKSGGNGIIDVLTSSCSQSWTCPWWKDSDRVHFGS
jgi:catechol 2,3-dioxygenase-like lactoylglutathione lyase family enzyme